MNITVIFIVCQVLSFVPAIVFHEVAHGFAASKLGDPTARSQGRLSLNPLRHIDPFGTVILPAILMFMGGPVFGYAKPVPYNPLYFKDRRKGEAIVGLAGPAANLVMALIGAALVWLFSPLMSAGLGESLVFSVFYLVFLPTFIRINLYFMFFNLIPIPPLDGSSVIALFLSNKQLASYYRIQAYALPIFMAVVILVPYILHINPIGIYLNATAGSLASLLLPAGL